MALPEQAAERSPNSCKPARRHPGCSPPRPPDRRAPRSACPGSLDTTRRTGARNPLRWQAHIWAPRYLSCATPPSLTQSPPFPLVPPWVSALPDRSAFPVFTVALIARAVDVPLEGLLVAQLR